MICTNYTTISSPSNIMGGYSCQNPRSDLKNMYSSMFTHHIWFCLLFFRAIVGVPKTMLEYEVYSLDVRVGVRLAIAFNKIDFARLPPKYRLNLRGCGDTAVTQRGESKGVFSRPPGSSSPICRVSCSGHPWRP